MQQSRLPHTQPWDTSYPPGVSTKDLMHRGSKNPRCVGGFPFPANVGKNGKEKHGVGYVQHNFRLDVFLYFCLISWFHPPAPPEPAGRSTVNTNEQHGKKKRLPVDHYQTKTLSMLRLRHAIPQSPFRLFLS